MSSSTNQFVSGTPLNVVDLAKAMEKLSNTKEPSNRTGLSGLKGRWVLDKQIKEVKVLVAGKGKNLSELGIIEKISSIVSTASVDLEQLNKITLGLVAWKGRIEFKQQNISPIGKFFLKLLGIEGKSQQVIKEITKTINVIKQSSLSKEIEYLTNKKNGLDNSFKTEQAKLIKLKENTLQSKIGALEKKLVEITRASNSQLQRTNDQIEKAEEKKLSHIDSEITKIQGELTKKLGTDQIGDLNQKVLTAQENLEKSPGKKNQEVRNKAFARWEKVVQLTGQLGEKIASKDSDIAKVKSAAQEGKAVAQSEHDQAIRGVKLEIENDKALQEGYTSSLSAQEQTVAKIGHQIQIIEGRITSKQEEISRLQNLESPIAADDPITVDVEHRNSIPGQSAVYALLDPSPPPFEIRLEKIKENIRNALGYGEHGHASTTYLEYQQKMIFGFSFGQRKTVNELKGQDLNENDLQDMLEGGNEVTNMFHLALSLEEQIKYSQGKTPEYIAKLRSMLADLERSLPLALQGRALDHTTDTSKSKATRDAIAAKHHRTKKTPKNTLSDDVNQALLNMNPGKRLFLPIGTAGHAALLCLKKEQNGMITPIIYNTGEGVEAFESPVTQIKNQFRAQQKSPLKVTYPSFSIQSSFDLSTLLKNRQTDQNISTLYDEAKKLFGRHVTKSKPQETQVSGVCSFQVFTAAFHDILGEADHHQFQYDHFRQIQSEFKQISQTLTVENSPSPSLVSPSVHFLGAHDQQFNPQAIATGVHQALLDDLTKEIQVLDSKLAKQKK